jgi:hypothetical protein
MRELLGYGLVLVLMGCGSGGGGEEDRDADEPDGTVDVVSEVVPDGLADVETDVPAVGPLPEGDTGIAARYPGDEGIGDDPEVIFADDFESYADGSELGSRWNGGVYHNALITTESANVYMGSQALEFYSPRQDAELSNGVAVDLVEHEDVMFLRWVSKFDGSFDVVGSSHNGGGMSSSYFEDGMATPGEPADGYNKFLVEYECWRGEETVANPGNLNVYVYHPDQRSGYGDHFFPTGVVTPYDPDPFDFGEEFVARPDVIPELGRWYTYEVMVRANTPGMRDGRIACWLDGALIADFLNVRFRETTTLRIDRFNLSLHIGSNTRSETWKWYDNVVAARLYIGPVHAP